MNSLLFLLSSSVNLQSNDSLAFEQYYTQRNSLKNPKELKECKDGSRSAQETPTPRVFSFFFAVITPTMVPHSAKRNFYSKGLEMYNPIGNLIIAISEWFTNRPEIMRSRTIRGRIEADHRTALHH